MPDGINADFSELMNLAADLAGVPAEASKNVRAAIQFTSVDLKKDWRKGAKRSGLEGYAASITFETKETASGITSEIGPEVDRAQGMFGLVEDGGGGVKSAPQHAGRDAAKRAEPDFVRGLEIAIGKPLEDL